MRISALIAVGCVVSLAACANNSDVRTPDGAAFTCPQVAVVRNLATMSDYGREEAKAENLVAKADFGTVAGGCSVEENGIDIRFTVSMSAVRGARLGGDRASFPFFVAVVSPEGKVISKEPMTAEFDFAGGKNAALRTEKLRVHLPSKPQEQAASQQLRVLLGWQVR